jgi:hypothetical protein
MESVRITSIELPDSMFSTTTVFEYRMELVDGVTSMGQPVDSRQEYFFSFRLC